jgi:dihydroorotate dehydrogenase (fumarate)
MSEYSIGHLEVDSPFGNAGGVVKHVEDVEKMAHTGVGWIEAGSYTIEPRIGNGPNGEVVYHHNPETGETFNSLGMPNKGMDEVETEIPAMADIAHGFGKPLVVNVAPVSEDPATESAELIERAYVAGADAVLLNAGCPNVVTEGGGRHEILSHNVEALEVVLGGLEQVVEKYQPIFIRMSPTLEVKGLVDGKASVAARVLRASGVVNAVFTPNTWPGHKPLDERNQPILEVPGNVGGKSGPATAKLAAKETYWYSYSLRNSDISVVSSGGITNGEELAKRMGYSEADAGAGTTFFYESGDWEHDVDKLLWEFQDNSA